jgi:hemerythrin
LNDVGNISAVSGHPLEGARWSESLTLGIPLIDEQHKQLFDVAASLRAEGNQLGVMRALAVLNDHVTSHFSDEEALMNACRYPGLEAHCRLHAHFRDALTDLLKRARKMTLDGVAKEVSELIDGCLSEHMMEADRAYAPHVARMRSSEN